MGCWDHGNVPSRAYPAARIQPRGDGMPPASRVVGVTRGYAVKAEISAYATPTCTMMARPKNTGHGFFLKSRAKGVSFRNAFGQQLKAADGAQRCDEQPQTDNHGTDDAGCLRLPV